MRIRTIKPEFWRHRVMARLPDDTQLIAIGLLSCADDEGYFQADPEIVRGEIAPYRENLARLRECLDQLREAEWIEVVEHPIQGLIGRIKTWETHQRVDHPKTSTLKTYFLSNDSRQLREDVEKLREALALEQGTGNREHVDIEKGSSVLIPPMAKGEFMSLGMADGWTPDFKEHWWNQWDGVGWVFKGQPIRKPEPLLRSLWPGWRASGNGIKPKQSPNRKPDIFMSDERGMPQIAP